MQLPSPIELINYPAFAHAGIQVYIKRDDLIHHAISGNKWRKLKYNLLFAQQQSCAGIITFGGAYSNHLAAAAFAAQTHQLKMVAVVRGEEIDTTNPTMRFITLCGGEILPVSRSRYAQKDSPDFLQELKDLYPNLAVVPEGGANILGVQGCVEICEELPFAPNILVCPVGTATTFSGLILGSAAQTRLLGFCAVKGGGYLNTHVQNFVALGMQAGFGSATFGQWRLVEDFHFGGFGKVTSEIIRFMNDFYQTTGIPLDPIYTGKMMYGLVQMVKNGEIKPETSVVALHTGGLQGIAGMNERLKKKNLEIINYG